MSEATLPRPTRVGDNVQRADDVVKLTGGAVYASDMVLPGMLHAQVKKSPHARAKIIAIDTSKAESLPGVHAVLTGKELDYRIGLYVVDKPVLAKDFVRHFGEAVAAVAAESLDIASRAVDLIDVEYEVLPPVLNQMEALEPDAPRVHPDLGSYEYVKAAFSPQPGTNIPNITRIRKGDIEAGFAEANWIVEREYTNPSVQHVPLETHVAIVEWKAGDEVTIWTSAQSPFTVRDLFCHAFKLPHNKVRVVIPHVGGGFGGKAGIHLEPLLACLSRKCGGRPVKLHASREEEFSLLPCRSALTYRIKTGIASDGRITAQHLTMFWDAGAYADYAVNVTRASAYSAAGPYEVPNAWVDAYTIYTNKPWGTAYRGFGHVEFFWGLERHMELISEVIGMDPLEFRRKNLLRPGSRTITGEVINEHTGNPIKCLDAAAKAINYGVLTSEERERETRTGRKIGKGLATLHKAPAMPSFTSTAAIIKMNSDGSVIVNVALTEIGQGTATVVAQMAADRLRFPIERVKVAVERDTDKDPYDWQTVASKGLLLTGNAVIAACEDLLKRAYADAAPILRAQPADLDHDAEKIFIKQRPEESLTFASLSIGYAYPNGNGAGGPLIGFGRYTAQGLTSLDKETGQGLPALDWTYGAHGVIAEVDPATGEYKVIKIASAFDVGKVINPGTLRGQCIGGMIQGLGTAQCEAYLYDDEGHLLNPSLTDNKILTSQDLPEQIECIAVETPQLDGPFGARGVGEHPMIGVAPALANAIHDATGADLTHMPVRFEDVWRAIHNKRPADTWATRVVVDDQSAAGE